MGKMTLQQMITQLAGGMAVSTQIFVITLLFSLPLGLVIAFGRMSKNKLIQTIVKVYISIMRGTPLMLQLMVVYFGPYYLFRIKVGSSYRLWATFIGFVINYAAYFAEIYRSGIQSIPRGQYEAAEVLGYSRLQTFMKIVLPQVIKRILPAMGNEIITLVKDTSLAFAIGVAEMFSTAKALVASQVSMLPFVFAALTMNSVGRAAQSVVLEVRRQFRDITGLMEGKADPDYARCVDLCTKASLKEMVLPTVIAVVTPIVVGMILGFKGVVGLLAGATVTGFLMAIYMANAGGAWDNAKKYIEAGNFGGKGSDCHKAGVVGDTVGDPFKDTAGPAINILIKLLSMVSIVFAGLIVNYAIL